MSIEDSRILANELENENLAADMLDAVSQLHSEDAPVELAQLGELPKTDRFAQPDNGEGAGDNRYRVENGIVQLPASTSLDDMRVEGNDLVLVQSDGTEIIIIDGALKIPTLLLGDVELSQQVLLAALEDSGINVAAGPDGSYSATGTPPSSGADFETIEERQAEAIALAELLGDTSFGDGDGFEDNGVDDGQPTILSPLTQAFVLDEAVIVDNDQNNQTISGRLPFEQGPDFGTITRVEFSGAGNVDEEGLGAAQALAGITSGGSPITVTSFAASTDGSILSFVALEGRDANGALVFQLTINNRVSGDFTFELVGKLDHPDAGSGGTQADLVDLLRLGFTYTVTDLDGDFVTGSFNIDVMDDAPVRGQEVRGTAEDEAVNGGNNEADGLSAVSTGALNIRWGADDADTAADLGGLGDRSIAFTDATVSVANAYNGASLTSLGLPVSTAVLANGTLVGYTGSTVPTSSAAANVVFHATLSDNGSGSYTFTLVKPLDHAAGDGANGENDLSLSFGYTATDSDGDTVTGRFTVDVRDDVATIGAPFADGIVEEEQKQVAGDGNEGTEGEGDADSFGGFLGLQFRDRTTHETGGSLSISWGSDDANDGNGQPGDRSVQFGPDAVANLTALNLTSDGDVIKYTTVTVSGQQVLLAYTGSMIPTTVPTTTNGALVGNIVFSVALSDTGAGSYAFKLYDTLDHQGSVQGEDSQILNFQFTATDSDGDVTQSATFSVKVIDDQPIALGTFLDRYVEEEELSGGNEDGAPGGLFPDADGNYPFVGYRNLTTDKADGSLNIAWGGDDGNKNVNGGFTGTQVAGDRSVVFATGTGAAKILTANEVSQFLTVSGGNGPVAIGSLTSEGKPLVFTLSANGSILTASADGKTVFTVKLSDQDNGSFDFDLDGVLDHPVKASGAANEDVLSFKFTFTARDGDGDVARNEFTVKVIDDVPTVEDNAVVQLDDDSLVVGATPIVATGILENQLGADGGKVSWLSNGMTLGNNDLWYQHVSPTELIITQNQNGQTVQVVKMTITNQATGAYSIEQLAPVRHPVGGVEDNIEFTVSYEARDGDNDTAAGTITVKINDDVTVAHYSGRVTLAEDANADTGVFTQSSANGQFKFDAGADGAKVTSIAYGFGGNVINDPDQPVGEPFTTTPLTSGGQAITVGNVAGDPLKIEGKLADGTVIFRVEVTNPVTGAYTVTQLGPIDHPEANETGAADPLRMKVNFTVTDGDGDTSSSSIQIDILDDAPVARYSGRVTLSEDANADTGAFTQSSANGQFKFDAGADGAKVTSIAYGFGGNVINDPDQPAGAPFTTIPLTSGGQAITVGNVAGDPLKIEGKLADGTVIFRIEVTNPVTGAYTVTQLGPIDHPEANETGAADPLRMRVNFTVTDGDGDTSSSSIQIDILDDAPVLFGSLAASNLLVNGNFTSGTWLLVSTRN